MPEACAPNLWVGPSVHKLTALHQLQGTLAAMFGTASCMQTLLPQNFDACIYCFRVSMEIHDRVRVGMVLSIPAVLMSARINTCSCMNTTF
jgi:hypothetical protein